MSSWAQAIVAAKKAVAAPTTAMVVAAAGPWARMGFTRAMRKTPAVTMVAAWMRADTGVGPSMAAGSQTYSGSWADLPTAPRKSRKAMAVSVPLEAPLRWANTVPYWSEPKVAKIRNMAIRKPKSPTRLVTNA